MRSVSDMIYRTREAGWGFHDMHYTARDKTLFRL